MIETSHKILFNGRVNTDDNSGIDENSSFFIDSKKGAFTLKITLFGTMKKEANFKISSSEKVKYLYLYNYADSLYFSIEDRMLKGR